MFVRKRDKTEPRTEVCADSQRLTVPLYRTSDTAVLSVVGKWRPSSFSLEFSVVVIDVAIVVCGFVL